MPKPSLDTEATYRVAIGSFPPHNMTVLHMPAANMTPDPRTYTEALLTRWRSATLVPNSQDGIETFSHMSGMFSVRLSNVQALSVERMDIHSKVAHDLALYYQALYTPPPPLEPGRA